MAQGVELATGYVSLTVSARGITQELQRELGAPVDKASQNAGKSIEDGIGGGASRGAQAAKAAISVIGSAAILSGLNRAKDAASGLQQAVGGTAAVFQDAGEAVDEFAEGAAESVGLSERVARELTSQLGASLKGYGFAVDEAAEKSIELTQIGADLAATFGGTTADAVAALSSALRGEFDPLERYGVALRQSAIDAEAVRLGLVAQGAEVDNMSRAQAALSLITQQGADAQGQFGREADSAAGQQQIAAAKMEDSAANLGESLLPIYAQISETVGTVADVFAALPGPVQTGILALAGVAALAGPLTNVVSLYRAFTPAVAANTAAVTTNAAATNSAAAVQTLYAGSTARATLATRAFSTALGVGVAAFAGYAVGSGIVAESRRRAAEEGGELVDQFEAELAAAQNYEQFAAILNQRISEYNGLVDDANSGADIFDNDDLSEASHVIGPFIEQQIALAEAIQAVAAETGDADAAFELFNGNAAEATALLEQGLTPAEVAAELSAMDLAGAMAEAAEPTEDFAEAISAANDELADLFDISDTLPVIEANLRDALAAAAAEALRLADAQAGSEERYDSFVQSINASLGNVDDYAQALLNSGLSAEEAAGLTNAYIDKIFDLRDEFGLTRGQAEELRVQLGLDYPTVTARVEAVGLAETNQWFAELYDWLTRIQPALDNMTAHGIGVPDLSGFIPRAQGGPMVAGQSYLFEGHPEILTMGPGMMSGQVTPLSDIAAPASGSAGGDTFQFNGITDVAELAARVAREKNRRVLMTARS